VLYADDSTVNRNRHNLSHSVMNLVSPEYKPIMLPLHGLSRVHSKHSKPITFKITLLEGGGRGGVQGVGCISHGRIFLFARPYRLRIPPSLLSNGYKGSFLRDKGGRGVKPTTHHLVPCTLFYKRGNGNGVVMSQFLSNRIFY
jgi:hypothetical protein